MQEVQDEVLLKSYVEKLEYYKRRNIDILDLTDLFRKYSDELKSINKNNRVVKIEGTSSIQLMRDAILEYKKIKGYKFVVKILPEDYFRDEEYLNEVKSLDIEVSNDDSNMMHIVRLYAYLIHDLSINIIMSDDLTKVVLNAILKMNRAIIASTSWGKSLTVQDKLLSIYNIPPVGVIAPNTVAQGQSVRAYIASCKPLIKLVCDIYKEDGTIIKNHKVTFGGSIPFRHTLDLVKETADAINVTQSRKEGFALASQNIRNDKNTIDVNNLIDVRTIAEECRTYDGFMKVRQEYPQLMSISNDPNHKYRDNMDISRVLIVKNENEKLIYLVKDIKCDMFRRNEAVNIGIGTSYVKYLSSVSFDKVEGIFVALNKSIFYGEDTYDYFLDLYKDLFLESYMKYSIAEKNNFILYLMEIFGDRYGQFLIQYPKAIEYMQTSQDIVKASDVIMEDFLKANIEEILDFITEDVKDYSDMIAPPYSSIYTSNNINVFSFPNGTPYLDFILSHDTCSKYRKHYITKGRIARDALDVYGLDIGILQLPFVEIVPVDTKEGIAIKFPLMRGEIDLGDI